MTKIVIHNQFARALDTREGRNFVPASTLRRGDILSGSGERVVSVARDAASCQVNVEKNGYHRLVIWDARARVSLSSRTRDEDGVGTPEEIAYGEGWHSTENVNPYTSASERASWERGRAAKKQKMKLNSNARAGELRNRSFQPPKKKIANDASWKIIYEEEDIPGKTFSQTVQAPNEEEAKRKWRRTGTAYSRLKSVEKIGSKDYKSEKGYVAKLIDVKTGGILAKSEPHISNGEGLKKWIMTEAQKLIARGKRVKAEVGVEFFDPNMMDAKA